MSTGTLYLVATPIGNLGDISNRALEVLNSVDVIFCEDTRHSMQLLNHFGIKKKLESYYREIEIEKADVLISYLRDGKNIALISDAGMPCISDPGSYIARRVREENIPYTIIPGANAAISSIALTGVEGPFLFIGFLPDKKTQRMELLNEYASVKANLIFYVAPHDVNHILDDLYSSYGERDVYLVKEITKIHEQVICGKLGSINLEEPKGEFVVIVGISEKTTKKEYTEEDLMNMLDKLTKQGYSKKDAAQQISLETGISKNTIYKLSINKD